MATYSQKHISECSFWGNKKTDAETSLPQPWNLHPNKPQNTLKKPPLQFAISFNRTQKTTAIPHYECLSVYSSGADVFLLIISFSFSLLALLRN